MTKALALAHPNCAAHIAMPFMLAPCSRGDGFPQFTIFNGRFNWNDGSWWQSQGITVVPGDVVTAYVRYKKSDSSYAQPKASTSPTHYNSHISYAGLLAVAAPTHCLPSYDMYIESKKSGQGVHSNVQTSGASEVFTVLCTLLWSSGRLG